MKTLSATNFPVNITFIVSHMFGILCLHFYWILETLNHLFPWLCRELYSSHEFMGFLLLLKFSFNPCSLRRYRDYFNFLVPVETCFVTEFMVCFRETSVKCWDKDIFFWVWVKYCTDFYKFHLIHDVSHFHFFRLLFCGVTCPLVSVRCWSFQLLMYGVWDMLCKVFCLFYIFLWMWVSLHLGQMFRTEMSYS